MTLNDDPLGMLCAMVHPLGDMHRPGPPWAVILQFLVGLSAVGLGCTVPFGLLILTCSFGPLGLS